MLQILQILQRVLSFRPRSGTILGFSLETFRKTNSQCYIIITLTQKNHVVDFLKSSQYRDDFIFYFLLFFTNGFKSTFSNITNITNVTGVLQNVRQLYLSNITNYDKSMSDF